MLDVDDVVASYLIFKAKTIVELNMNALESWGCLSEGVEEIVRVLS